VSYIIEDCPQIIDKLIKYNKDYDFKLFVPYFNYTKKYRHLKTNNIILFSSWKTIYDYIVLKQENKI
jgi:hypothetical protein